MAKFFVKLALKALTILEKVALARLMVTRMTGNANFTAPNPTPDPPLADLTTAANTLDASRVAVAAAKSTLAEAVATQETDEKALEELMAQEGRYIDNRAKGDKAIIESAGVSATDEPSPVGEMPKVENLSLTHGDSPGEVDAAWNAVSKKKNYTIQVTADPIGSAAWITRGNPTKSSVTIDGLTSGQKVWMQVCANGTEGPGAFSDPAVITVP